MNLHTCKNKYLIAKKTTFIYDVLHNKLFQIHKVFFLPSDCFKAWIISSKLRQSTLVFYTRKSFSGQLVFEKILKYFSLNIPMYNFDPHCGSIPKKNLNLHYLRMLPHKFSIFGPKGFFLRRRFF